MQLPEHDSDRLRDLARRHLGDAATSLLAAVFHSVRLHRTEPCEAAGRHSRLGGVALLPPGYAWPVTDAGQPLRFLGQIDTDEIGAVASAPPLPARTLLAFFYEADDQQAWGFDPRDHQYWRVVAVDRAAAVPAEGPAGGATFRSHRIVPELVTTIPDPWEPPVEALWEADSDAVQRFCDEVSGGADEQPRHRMFGWPDLIQNPMQLECQLASNGISLDGPEGYRDPRAADLRAGAAEWMLLFQIDTDDEVGWMWGDVGTVYYWIRASDLHAGRFDRVWMIFQCC